MSFRDFKNLLIISGALAISACTKIPPQRSLPGPAPLPIDSIHLNTQLTVPDIRKVFTALNQDGKLNSLKTWFENVPEEDLRGLAQVFSSELYESALDSTGLVQILHERSDKQGFTAWKKSNPFSVNPAQWVLWNYLKDSAFTVLFPQHTSVFDLDVQNFLNQIPNHFESYEHLSDLEFREVDKAKISLEVRSLLANENLKKETVSFFSKMSEDSFSRRFFQSLTQSRKTDPKSFAAFSNALSKFASPEEDPAESKLQQLLESLKAIDTPPKEFFTTASKYLEKHPVYRQSIALMFEPLLTASIFNEAMVSIKESFETSEDFKLLSELPRKKPTDLPTEAFKTVYEKIEKALLPHFTVNVKYDPLLNFYAYLMTRTLEEYSRVNFEKLGLEKSQKIWEMPLKPLPEPVFQIKFVVDTEKGTLSEDWQNDLQHLNSTTLRVLKTLLPEKEIFKKAYYTFDPTKMDPPVETLTLDSILNFSLKRTFEMRPAVEPGIILQNVLAAMNLRQFDKNETLLTFFLKLAAKIDTSDIEMVDTYLFHRLTLQDYTPTTLPLVYQMFGDNEEYKENLTQIFNCFRLLHDLHHLGTENISGLKLPWAYLNELGSVTKANSENITVFSQLFKTLLSSEVFKLSRSKDYSELLRIIRNPNLIAQSFYSLSFLTEEDFAVFSQRVQNLNTKDSWSFLQKLSTESPNEFDSALKKIIEKHIHLLPNEDDLTAKERKWLVLFSKSKQFRTLHRIFTKNGSKENTAQFLKELKNFSKTGQLTRALDYLSRIQNDRMRALSQTLLELEKKGELGALLDTLISVTGL